MNVSALSATQPLAGQSAVRETELSPADRARAAQLRGSALRNASPAEQRAAVAAQFEAILVRQMLGKTMTAMLGTGGAAASVYGDLLTDTVAQKLTSGPGIGLAVLLDRQLAPRIPTQPAETPSAQ